jgi:hypothetical protein
MIRLAGEIVLVIEVGTARRAHAWLLQIVEYSHEA